MLCAPHLSTTVPSLNRGRRLMPSITLSVGGGMLARSRAVEKRSIRLPSWWLTWRGRGRGVEEARRKAKGSKRAKWKNGIRSSSVQQNPHVRAYVCSSATQELLAMLKCVRTLPVFQCSRPQTAAHIEHIIITMHTYVL